MSKRYPYVTHTTPPLVLDVQPEGEGENIEWVVTLSGDRIKEQARTRTEADALVVADGIWAHYEQRRKDEA